MECRILDYNYLFQENAAVSASTADTSFPVSNLQTYSRSKVWRSTGNFVIDATNNKIDFKISGGGSQLHATVASATYTPTTLATAIVAALTAQDGGNTYTVTYSTLTGKWTITTSGAYLSLLWASGTNTATSTGPAIGFAADSTGATTYTAPNIAIHTEEWILIDTVAGALIDTFAQFFDPLVGIPFTTGALLYIQGNATNSWSAPSVSVALTVDTTFEAVSYFWSSSQSYRYWRLKIVDPRNTNLYVEVSKLAIGKATQLSRIPKNGFTYGLMDQSQVQTTPYGHQFADVYPPMKMLSFDYAGLTYADIQTIESIFRRVGTTTPVVVAFDDTETLFDKDQFLIYGAFAPKVNFKHTMKSFFGQQTSLREVF